MRKTIVCATFTSKFTFTDELVIANQVGYITVFTLNCKNQVNSIPLFGEVNGQISPVSGKCSAFATRFLCKTFQSSRFSEWRMTSISSASPKTNRRAATETSACSTKSSSLASARPSAKARPRQSSHSPPSPFGSLVDSDQTSSSAANLSCSAWASSSHTSLSRTNSSWSTKHSFISTRSLILSFVKSTENKITGFFKFKSWRSFIPRIGGFSATILQKAPSRRLQKIFLFPSELDERRCVSEKLNH